MAVVSRPLDQSRRVSPIERLRQTLPFVWMTVVAYALLLVLGYLLLSPVISWGQRQLDDIRYGFPRTTFATGFVGHGEQGGAPTQFLALNLHGQVSVLELPGGDASEVRVIPGPYLVGADGQYVVPQVELADLTGDGHVDLLLYVRDEIVVYVNEQGSFRIVTPAERAALMAQTRERR